MFAHGTQIQCETPQRSAEQQQPFKPSILKPPTGALMRISDRERGPVNATSVRTLATADAPQDSARCESLAASIGLKEEFKER
jgi:hypothetical protein